MKAELKTITPDIAKKLLAKNTKNRALTISHVDYLAKEIKSGRWKVNGDMIRISNSGRILDGQHRLNAVLKCDLTIQSWVMEGLDDDIFNTIDTGKKRSGGDTLGCLGQQNAYRLAAALVVIDGYFTNRSESCVRYSNTEMQELLEKYPDAPNFIYPLKGKGLVHPSVIDACNYLFSKKSPNHAAWFLNRVLKGDGLEQGDPEYVLRERLVANSISKAKLIKAHIFALCIKAWNHHRAGKTISALKLTERNGRLVEFPVVQ